MKLSEKIVKEAKESKHCAPTLMAIAEEVEQLESQLKALTEENEQQGKFINKISEFVEKEGIGELGKESGDSLIKAFVKLTEEKERFRMAFKRLWKTRPDTAPDLERDEYDAYLELYNQVVEEDETQMQNDES